ncbi:hypothetical protein [Pseudomonas frederiksbergensis]|uniref:hypothetical protein n=1 Tax=Pseudomonas frederiksbergensis TaxID=104087 RepID=UPI0013D0DD17|nr:hypothetical protein [Pseudomonas frederiksbergensis]
MKGDFVESFKAQSDEVEHDERQPSSEFRIEVRTPSEKTIRAMVEASDICQRFGSVDSMLQAEEGET